MTVEYLTSGFVYDSYPQLIKLTVISIKFLNECFSDSITTIVDLDLKLVIV
jgi:hypothetical protein